MYFIAVMFDYERITSEVKGQGSGWSEIDVRRTGEWGDSEERRKWIEKKVVTV